MHSYPDKTKTDNTICYFTDNATPPSDSISSVQTSFSFPNPSGNIVSNLSEDGSSTAQSTYLQAAVIPEELETSILQKLLNPRQISLLQKNTSTEFQSYSSGAAPSTTAILESVHIVGLSYSFAQGIIALSMDGGGGAEFVFVTSHAINSI